MPDLSLSSPEMLALKRIVHNSDHDVPDEDDIPTRDEHMDGHDNPSLAAEDYAHEFALEKLLVKVDNACPVCGDPECDRGHAYIGSSMIHADKHPENQPRGRR